MGFSRALFFSKKNLAQIPKERRKMATQRRTVVTLRQQREPMQLPNVSISNLAAKKQEEKKRRQFWRRYEESVAKSVSRRRRGVCRRGHSSRVFHVDANDDELSVRQRRDIRERVENVV